MRRLLFILKRREDYNSILHSPRGLSTGLFNSANFIVEALNDNGVESYLEVAVDNNCIDRLVTKHQPTDVIIEALWVVPTKFDILTQLHPDVRWIVRLHSEMPFMAGEGMAMNWLGDYLSYPNVCVGINAPRMLSEIQTYMQIKFNWNKEQVEERVFYLPNAYPNNFTSKKLDKNKTFIDIGCFGAIRPLKNHLLQAFAALKFVKSVNKKLRFHINIGRQEMKGEPILHNLQGLFVQLAGTEHELIMHTWKQHEDFIELCGQMDIGMQCNFSETFNIVGADLVSQGVPLVGSKEIPWSSWFFNADPASSYSMCDALARCYDLPMLNVKLNQYNLTKYTSKTIKTWKKQFN